MLRLRSQADRQMIGLDGVDRLYALKPLPPNPRAGQVHVMVEIPKTVAFSPVNRAVARNFAWVILVFVAAGSLAWLMGSKFVVGYVKVRVHANRGSPRRANLAGKRAGKGQHFLPRCRFALSRTRAVCYTGMRPCFFFGRSSFLSRRISKD
jgi:hypothetical protein